MPSSSLTPTELCYFSVWLNHSSLWALYCRCQVRFIVQLLYLVVLFSKSKWHHLLSPPYSFRRTFLFHTTKTFEFVLLKPHAKAKAIDAPVADIILLCTSCLIYSLRLCSTLFIPYILPLPHQSASLICEILFPNFWERCTSLACLLWISLGRP